MAILVASAKITIELYGAADTKRLAVDHHGGPQRFNSNTASECASAKIAIAITRSPDPSSCAVLVSIISIISYLLRLVNEKRLAGKMSTRFLRSGPVESVPGGRMDPITCRTSRDPQESTMTDLLDLFYSSRRYDPLLLSIPKSKLLRIQTNYYRREK